MNKPDLSKVGKSTAYKIGYRDGAKDVNKLIQALTDVEEWWLGQGMKEIVGGAPACIFTVRAILAELKGQDDE